MASDIPPPLPQQTPAVEGRRSRRTLASVVLGVLACPLSCLTGIPGLICGVMGLRQIEASERPGSSVRYTGRSLALAGIFISGMMMFLSPVDPRWRRSAGGPVTGGPVIGRRWPLSFRT